MDFSAGIVAKDTIKEFRMSLKEFEELKALLFRKVLAIVDDTCQISRIISRISHRCISVRLGVLDVIRIDPFVIMHVFNNLEVEFRSERSSSKESRLRVSTHVYRFVVNRYRVIAERNVGSEQTKIVSADDKMITTGLVGENSGFHRRDESRGMELR